MNNDEASVQYTVTACFSFAGKVILQNYNPNSNLIEKLLIPKGPSQYMYTNE